MQIDVAEYYRKYGPMVLRRCRLLLKDEDRAMDAVQDVFVKLLQNQDRLSGTYPSSLLFRMATNVCLNIIRYDKSRPQADCGDILAYIAANDDMESRIAVRDYIERIFAKEKATTGELAVMHYVDKMTLNEVAEISGMSVSGVRKRLRKLTETAKSLDMEEEI
ncbi:MAG: sigma-70 family RNA polymerase sigma factor [Spirochaetota bacterium]